MTGPREHDVAIKKQAGLRTMELAKQHMDALAYRAQRQAEMDAGSLSAALEASCHCPQCGRDIAMMPHRAGCQVPWFGRQSVLPSWFASAMMSQQEMNLRASMSRLTEPPTLPAVPAPEVPLPKAVAKPRPKLGDRWRALRQKIHDMLLDLVEAAITWGEDMQERIYDFVDAVEERRRV